MSCREHPSRYFHVSAAIRISGINARSISINKTIKEMWKSKSKYCHVLGEIITGIALYDSPLSELGRIISDGKFLYNGTMSLQIVSPRSWSLTGNFRRDLKIHRMTGSTVKMTISLLWTCLSRAEYELSGNRLIVPILLPRLEHPVCKITQKRCDGRPHLEWDP
ncbi:U2 protein [Mundri virus]|uniref:U2 protein n=1 Tax=Mundri virus TaxID=2913478 RepID=UPI002481D8FC|nr:U2 protein [Mundri virus]UJY53553.1 U2 protein [Mundri virus]